MKKIFNNKIFRYIFFAITSFIIDMLLFQLIDLFLEKVIDYEAIIVATILARICSSIYNYFMTSRFVFKIHSHKTFYKYFLTVIINMFLSTIIVYTINRFFIDTYASIIKLVVDGIIFIINYLINNNLVFKKN